MIRLSTSPPNTAVTVCATVAGSSGVSVPSPARSTHTFVADTEVTVIVETAAEAFSRLADS